MQSYCEISEQTACLRGVSLARRLHFQSDMLMAHSLITRSITVSIGRPGVMKFYRFIAHW